MLTQEKLNKQYARKEKAVKKIRRKYPYDTSVKSHKCDKGIADYQGVRDLPIVKT